MRRWGRQTLTSKKNERKDTFIKITDGKAVITTDIDKLQKPIWKVLKPAFLKVKNWKYWKNSQTSTKTKWSKYKQQTDWINKSLPINKFPWLDRYTAKFYQAFETTQISMPFILFHEVWSWCCTVFPIVPLFRMQRQVSISSR